MTQRIPWARVLVEGLVIVVSILLALATDAWWDDRRDRAEEQEALEALHTDFTTLRSQVEGLANFYQRGVEGMESLFELSDTPRSSFPLADAESALRRMLLAPTYEPGERTLEALISSGRIELIRNGELRQLLTAWPQRVLEIRDGEIVSREFIRQTLIPYAAEQGVPLTRVYAVDDPERPRSLVSPEDAIAAYSRVLADPRFRGLLSYRVDWERGTVGGYRSALRLADRILVALEREID